MDGLDMMQGAQKGPKACTTCAKAKARCFPLDGGGLKCERCFRLNKECYSRTPAPPRVKKRQKRSRVAELEKRLNELSSQFEGGHQGLQHAAANGTGQHDQGPPHSGGHHPGKGLLQNGGGAADKGGDLLSLEHFFPPAEIKQSAVREGSNETQTGGGSPDAPRPESSAASAAHSASTTASAASTKASASTVNTASTTATSTTSAAWPQPPEAEFLLAQFHNTSAPLLPFVVVPRHMKAADLKAERPFLWQGIMVAGCFLDAPRQARLGDDMLAQVGKAALAEGVRSLDLLQGLEFLLAWFIFVLESSQTTHLLFLARSMCVNLKAMSYASTGENAPYSHLDHLRAYAGMYYFNTAIFTLNKRHDVLMKTEQLESYLAVLETSKEYPSDEYLVKLVRAQQLAQSISLTLGLDPATPTSLSLPLPMVIGSFRDLIDTFRVTLPPHLACNPTSQCHLSTAEMLLADVAISDPHGESQKLPLAERLQVLWAGVHALKAFFRVRFAETDRFTAKELGAPVFMTIMMSDVAFAFITGIKLLTLSVPGWPPEQVAKEMALNSILTRQIADIESLIARRRCGSAGSGTGSGGGGGGGGETGPWTEDPLERQVRLMRLAQATVALQLGGLSTQKMTQMFAGDVGGASLQALLDDGAGGLAFC